MTAPLLTRIMRGSSAETLAAVTGGERHAVLVGDVLDQLRRLPDGCVQCVVTSPPYYGLRDYGVDGQIGIERSPAEFIAALVAVFDEVQRVLRSDGLCFVNIGDSYAGSGKGPTTDASTLGYGRGVKGHEKVVQRTAQLRQGFHDDHKYTGIPPKNLLLIPERFAIAMQDAGWWVRSRIAWCKKSAMPESVRDRPTSAWEHIWMFSKSRTYFYDAEAVKVPSARPGDGGHFGGAKGRAYEPQVGDSNYRNGSHQAGREFYAAPSANLRNFWLLGPEPFSGGHFASYPTELVRRCILAGTSERGACAACGAPWARGVERTQRDGFRRETPTENLRGSNRGAALGVRPGEVNGQYDPHGDSLARYERTTAGWQPTCVCGTTETRSQIVLDPFLGSGTTLLVAKHLGRDGVGIELNPEYAEMARRRIETDVPKWARPAKVKRQPKPVSSQAALWEATG